MPTSSNKFWRGTTCSCRFRRTGQPGSLNLRWCIDYISSMSFLYTKNEFVPRTFTVKPLNDIPEDATQSIGVSLGAWVFASSLSKHSSFLWLARLICGSYYANPVDKSHIEKMNKKLQITCPLRAVGPAIFEKEHEIQQFENRHHSIASFLQHSKVDNKGKGGCTVSWNKHGGADTAQGPQLILVCCSFISLPSASQAAHAPVSGGQWSPWLQSGLLWLPRCPADVVCQLLMAVVWKHPCKNGSSSKP